MALINHPFQINETLALWELRITNYVSAGLATQERHYELPRALLVIAADNEMSDRLEWLGSLPKWF
jgi:hypothetical protein